MRLDLKEILEKKKEKERNEVDERRKRFGNRKVENSESKQNPSTSQPKNSPRKEEDNDDKFLNTHLNNDDQFLNTHINNVSPISPTIQNIKPLKDRTFKRCVSAGVIALIILFCIGIALGALLGSGGKFKFVNKFF